MTHDLEGRRVLVTGAGQGVGFGIAAALADEGAQVLLNDVVAERADGAAASLREHGADAKGLAFDVTDHGAVHDAIGRVGRVDILINNAGNAGTDGFGSLSAFVDSTPDEWQTFVAVNLYGVMNCVQAVLPGMIDAGWGRIVNVVSDASRTAQSRMAAYGAAKAAAASFGRGIAHEVARHGITVNNVSLGTMRTEATAAFWDDPDSEAQRAGMLADYMVRRPGEPEDVAWMVAALVSPRAAWVTGQTIAVNGGYSVTL